MGKKKLIQIFYMEIKNQGDIFINRQKTNRASFQPTEMLTLRCGYQENINLTQ
jgi:hypothetical protein